MPQAPSANMGIILPTDHGDDDVWDVILDEALGVVVDRHDHTTGKGVRIPAVALNINADVPWASGGTSYAITDVKAIDLFPSAAAGMSAFAGALFLNAADNELYWRTTTGTNVQLTSGAALNVAAFAGGIGGDYVVSGALVSYDDALDTYLFQQQGSPRPWARVRTGDVDIYETAASIVNRVRLQSPAALAASYALTFPAALPGSTQILQLASGGAISASNTVGALSVAGALSATGNLTIDGNTTLGNAGSDTCSISGPATVGGTLGVTGLSTLTGGMSTSSVAMTGGDTLTHPSRFISIGPGAFAPLSTNTLLESFVAGGAGGAASGGTYVGVRFGTSGALLAAVPLRAGDKITSAVAKLVTSGGSTVSTTISLQNQSALASATFTGIRSATASGLSLSGMTAAITAGSTTINSGDAYSIFVSCNDAANQMHLVSVDITYER